MKRPKTGSTPKQYAYATRRLGGGGKSKKEIALLSGFSKSVAENAKYKIENTEGYKNAVIELAAQSHNIIMAIFAEYSARGLDGFSNKDLNGAMNAISSAWEKFNKARAPRANETPEGNPLRAVFMQKVQHQTINAPTLAEQSTPFAHSVKKVKKEVEVVDVVQRKEPDLDF